MKCSLIKKALKSTFEKQLSDITRRYEKYGHDWRSTIRCNERKRILTFDHVLIVDDLNAPLEDQDLEYLQAVGQLISDVNLVLEETGADVRLYEQLTKAQVGATTYA